jgi:hypothetical protein
MKREIKTLEEEGNTKEADKIKSSKRYRELEPEGKDLERFLKNVDSWKRKIGTDIKKTGTDPDGINKRKLDEHIRKAREKVKLNGGK